MRNQFTLVLPFVLFAITAIAQAPPCSFDNELKEFYQADPMGYTIGRNAQDAAIQRYRATHTGINYIPNPSGGNSNALIGGNGCDAAKYILPVVVHIIHRTQDSVMGIVSNITDAQVQSQIDELNKNFSNYYQQGSNAVNTGIQFCLAQTKPDGSSFTGINRISSSLSIHSRKDADSIIKLVHYPTDSYINIYVVDVFKANRGYYEWMMKGDFPENTKAVITKLALQSRNA